jgi:hypothetical protein
MRAWSADRGRTTNVSSRESFERANAQREGTRCSLKRIERG